MASRRDDVVTLLLRGLGPAEVARELGISRARVYQLLDRIRESGEYSVEIQVKGARGVELRDVEEYVRRQLAAAGVRAQRSE